jgi:hypothetical protein
MKMMLVVELRVAPIFSHENERESWRADRIFEKHTKNLSQKVVHNVSSIQY